MVSQKIAVSEMFSGWPDDRGCFAETGFIRWAASVARCSVLDLPLGFPTRRHRRRRHCAGVVAHVLISNLALGGIHS
jgi:hypothetical protein